MQTWRERARDGDVLLVVDVQNDFCAGGTLAVPRGAEVVPVINQMMRAWPFVVLTQDWHPPGHGSFASAHPGARPFMRHTGAAGPETLWPDHCVQGSHGAEFHPELATDRAELIVRKGLEPQHDAYSAFFDNAHQRPSGLAAYFNARGVRRVVIAGLATDVCVTHSALDARQQGFEVLVALDGCRAIDTQGSLQHAFKALHAAGVTLLDSGPAPSAAAHRP